MGNSQELEFFHVTFTITIPFPSAKRPIAKSIINLVSHGTLTERRTTSDSTKIRLATRSVVVGNRFPTTGANRHRYDSRPFRRRRKVDPPKVGRLVEGGGRVYSRGSSPTSCAPMIKRRRACRTYRPLSVARSSSPSRRISCSAKQSTRAPRYATASVAAALSRSPSLSRSLASRFERHRRSSATRSPFVSQVSLSTH